MFSSLNRTINAEYNKKGKEMPLITVDPKSSTVENYLDQIFDLIRQKIKEDVCQVSGFPPHDVIVNLGVCKIRNADFDAADFVVYLETCPNETLEGKADLLCEQTALTLIGMGITENRVVEVWPRFLPGPWCMIKNGEIVDSVKHQR